MLQQINKKIIFYISLVIILGTFNNKNFKNFELIILNPERNPEGDSYYVMPDYVSKGESNE